MPFSIFKFRIVRRRRRVRRFRPKTRSRQLFLEHRARALELVHTRLAHFNLSYNFKYNKVSIKNQSSRWGSCSRRGNLNFNYRIALLEPEVADYLIVHELCHLGEMNHSKKFWDLVARTLPHWRSLRRKMKEEGKRLF